MTKSLTLPQWRRSILERHLLAALLLLESVLSVIFISIGYLENNVYFRGVGVGLLISWATGAIAYLFKTINERQQATKAG
ncbi:MAG: hypothetical protein J9259_03430 [Thermoplasmata archaeon YP2-bin.285]|uniref:Uncharacterized protein n=1 Tax=Candidatus Sysuiplasma superficiale TaxID=2823368 RepID=A0A8J8CDW1_9ARCH|nr:hypothetical protein [Candidatus Sysuiplasma superficiale]